jgi:hypothetical protein
MLGAGGRAAAETYDEQATVWVASRAGAVITAVRAEVSFGPAVIGRDRGEGCHLEPPG